MSKAFTDEEGNDSSVVGRPVQRAARGSERPITREGHRKLTAELARLREERATTAASEALTREARLVELGHHVAQALATLESVRVVEAPADGRVAFGSTVTLRWESGREQTLSIVGPDEVDVKAGRMSVEAPLAKSLLGLAAGDTVEVVRPRGVEGATIISVS